MQNEPEIAARNDYLVLPMQDWMTSEWHASPLVRLPAGCVSVRGTVSPSQQFRGSPQLACDVRLVFRREDGTVVPGCGSGIGARPAFEAGEIVPVTGSELGQQPGVFPPTPAAFAYVVADSLGAQQRPYGLLAGVEFRLSHEQEIWIAAAATIEAFDASGNSLEIV